ncbi:MAG: hypothetical protein RDU89_06870 [bacterium]|nr:hypothetical protein [bacterium]
MIVYEYSYRILTPRGREIRRGVIETDVDHGRVLAYLRDRHPRKRVELAERREQAGGGAT